jgi:hypothetical protein
VIKDQTERAIKNAELQKSLTADELKNVRQTFSYQMMRTVNFITDLIYFDFSKNSDIVDSDIAGIFSTAKLG